MKSLKTLLKLLVSVALLLWIGQQVDWRALWLGVEHLPPWTLPVCLALYLTAQWISAWRWHLFLQHVGIVLPQSTLFGLYLGGMVYNQLLPGSIGGDGFRVWQTLSRQPKASKVAAITAILAERACGFAVLTGITLWLDPGSPFKPWLAGLMAFGFVCVLITACWPARLFPAWLRPAQHLLRHPRAVGVGVLLSVLIQGIMIGIHGLLAPGLPWTVLGWAYGCVTLLTLLPISFNGLGLREWGYAALLTHICPPEQAVRLSLLWAVIGLATSGFGVPFIWRGQSRRLSAPAYIEHG